MNSLRYVLSFVVAAGIFAGSNVNAQEGSKPAVQMAIDRSLKLLSNEVPGWINENHCASCHNQGDAAIALIAGARLKRVDVAALQSTLDWLTEPKKWSTNRGLPEASDQQLANLQFAGALLAAYQLDHAKYQPALNDAAELLITDQADDGSWKIVSGGALASPITHGEILLTGTALEVVQASNVVGKDKHIAQATKWLAQQKPRNTLEAASLVIAMPQDLTNRKTTTGECISMILEAQDEQSGGWGPHRNAAPEVFDTALAVLALKCSDDRTANVSKAIDRGIDYLIAEQSADGSWPETTRPSNTVSYAHRISTTAWACRALMAVSKPASK